MQVGEGRGRLGGVEEGRGGRGGLEIPGTCRVAAGARVVSTAAKRHELAGARAGG